ncbi:MAG TPA: hypothetical protein VFY17_07725 [Pilimelia sp.]|nr:hypothetical protein [Pilimelia sp.]
MRMRHFAVATVMACGVLAPVAVATAATAAPTKPAASQAKPSKPSKPVKPVKPVKFAVSGVVSSVDADARTITVTVKGGASELRGKTTTFGVHATARVTVDDVQATLGDVQAGHKVNVQGDKVGAVYTAMRVHAGAVTS